MKKINMYFRVPEIKERWGISIELPIHETYSILLQEKSSGTYVYENCCYKKCDHELKVDESLYDSSTETLEEVTARLNRDMSKYLMIDGELYIKENEKEEAA